MADRNTVLNQLKDDIEKYVKPSVSPYKTSIAEVKRGIYKFDTIVNKPCVCFSMEDDKVEHEMFDSAGSNQVRFLNIYLYGYLDNDEMNKYDNIHQLVTDMEYFLDNNFTYSSNTYIGDVGVIEGGASAPVSFFDMTVMVVYEKNN